MTNYFQGIIGGMYMGAVIVELIKGNHQLAMIYAAYGFSCFVFSFMK